MSSSDIYDIYDGPKWHEIASKYGLIGIELTALNQLLHFHKRFSIFTDEFRLKETKWFRLTSKLQKHI